jgi:hypothetical protein
MNCPFFFQNYAISTNFILLYFAVFTFSGPVVHLQTEHCVCLRIALLVIGGISLKKSATCAASMLVGGFYCLYICFALFLAVSFLNVVTFFFPVTCVSTRMLRVYLHITFYFQQNEVILLPLLHHRCVNVQAPLCVI